MSTVGRSSSEVSLTEGTQSKEISRRKWGRYVEASLGFRNHWYPIRYSNDIPEGEIVPVRLLGESIVLTRVDGNVRGLQDRCAHRGVRLSAQPLCFQKGTISCWYHGWTYDVADGRLCDVLTSPQ